MEEDVNTIKYDLIKDIRTDVRKVKDRVCSLEERQIDVKLLESQVNVIDDNVKEIKTDIKEMSKDKSSRAWQFIFYIITLVLGSAVGFLIQKGG